ncbi:MAG: hypothetical protein HYU51_07765 [Candidatus Rokubacteria bacterium]|nr:hypothetical protein [Candidatus Rokubacteria bacterium]
MKHRITLSIDPAATRRAKKLAHARQTSVSALVEQFLRSAPMVGGEQAASFVERWAGKFTVTRAAPGDLRMKAIKAKYRLNAR